MRLHEITNTPGDYLLTDFQATVINELLQAIGDIRLSAAGCSRRKPAVGGDRTRVPVPNLLPDHCST
jgi:hypothetical protein